jgi:chromosome segregation ATPase
VRIKAQNRSIHIALEDKRSELESKKGTVDKLKLNYENLLYKQAYLQREIRACKDLATPNLTEIEKELTQTLATHTYSGELEQVNSKALALLESERQARVETEKVLDALKETHNEALKKLDKKRKFLDELGPKIEVISSLANDLHVQFELVNK